MKQNNSNKLVLVVISVLILLAGAYFGLGYLTQNKTKAKFNKLEIDINRLIVALGDSKIDLKPTKISYCRHDTGEFGKGRLSCAISLAIGPIDQANLNYASKYIGDSLIQSDFTSINGKQVNLDPAIPQLNSYKHSTSDISCSLSPSKSGVNDTFQIKINLVCLDYLNQPIYTVID